MNQFLVSITAGAGFLLSFLLVFHPLQQNIKANRWLGFFVFIIGCAFTSTYMLITEASVTNRFLFNCLNSLQFLLAPSLYISILYFINPAKRFTGKDCIHFIPFLLYVVTEFGLNRTSASISTFSLFAVNKNVSFLVRDILPFLAGFYLVISYRALIRHKANLKLIASSISDIQLDWLVQFLFILGLTVIIWINDALFELPGLTAAMPFVYTAAIFFLAYFAIRQKTIFAFKEKDIRQILDILENNEEEAIPSGMPAAIQTMDEEVPIGSGSEKAKPKRLSPLQITGLSAQLYALMENEKIFLDNDLNLPAVAEKLGISIHETSFLINNATNDNFYNFINKYRVEEAKKLLSSPKMDELSILGIAFASGFNSKTTFNTAFKKIAGVSPSQYSKTHKK